MVSRALPPPEEKPSILEKVKNRFIERAEEKYVDQSIDKVIDKCFSCIDCFIEGLSLKNESLKLDIEAKKRKLEEANGIIRLKKDKLAL